MAVQPSVTSLPGPPPLPPVNCIDTWMFQAMKDTPISNGLAILIGCTNSSEHVKEPLGRVVRDLATLQLTFSETLLFTTLCLNNPTVEHVKKVVKYTSELVLPEKWRRIVVTFSGYGNMEYLYTKDGRMHLIDDIVKPLQAKKLARLFFVDACGEFEELNYDHQPPTGNCFIARLPFDSLREGFWIQTLARELTNMSNIDETIQGVMTRVSKELNWEELVTESTLTEDVKLLQEALGKLAICNCIIWYYWIFFIDLMQLEYQGQPGVQPQPGQLGPYQQQQQYPQELVCSPVGTCLSQQQRGMPEGMYQSQQQPQQPRGLQLPSG